MFSGDVEVISPSIKEPKIVPRDNPEEAFRRDLSSIAIFNNEGLPKLVEKVKKFCLKDQSGSLKSLFSPDQLGRLKFDGDDREGPAEEIPFAGMQMSDDGGKNTEGEERRNNNRKERSRVKFFKFFTRFSDCEHIEMIGTGKNQILRQCIEDAIPIKDIREICLLQKHINFSIETNISDLKILHLQSHMIHALTNCF
jgi:hypothetical protein